MHMYPTEIACLPAHLPARYFGMACPEVDLKHQVATVTTMSAFRWFCQNDAILCLWQIALDKEPQLWYTNRRTDQSVLPVEGCALLLHLPCLDQTWPLS